MAAEAAGTDRDEVPGTGAGPRHFEKQPVKPDHEQPAEAEIERGYETELLELQFAFAAKIIAAKRTMGTAPRYDRDAHIKEIRRQQTAARKALLHRHREERKQRKHETRKDLTRDGGQGPS